MEFTLASPAVLDDDFATSVLGDASSIIVLEKDGVATISIAGNGSDANHIVLESGFTYQLGCAGNRECRRIQLGYPPHRNRRAFVSVDPGRDYLARLLV